MITYVMYLMGRTLYVTRYDYGILLDEDSVARLAVPWLTFLCFLVGLLVTMAACHCVTLVLRGEFELGALILLPVAELLIGVCAAWPLAIPAVVLYLIALAVLRLMQPLLLNWRQKVDEKKARFQIAEHPADPSGYEWLSRILADQGRYAEAAVPLEAWLRRDPENRVIKRKAELLRAQDQAAQRCSG